MSLFVKFAGVDKGVVFSLRVRIVNNTAMHFNAYPLIFYLHPFSYCLIFRYFGYLFTIIDVDYLFLFVLAQ